jgi:hypothetical protein
VTAPQPGTTVRLDSLADRLMFRLAYRNLGAYEAMVVNHTVNVGGVNGVRWYEIRDPNAASPTVFQQGTYSPDATFRWMGSIAMDHMGNIAVGYSTSSSTVYPSISYAGRLVTDPLGQLAQGEATLIAGTGSQIDTGARWGDYSDMTVDPVDDCTFWFTTEYIRDTGQRSWRTRIGAFRFPSCTTAPPPSPVPATGTPPTATRTPTITPTACAGSNIYTGSITNADPTQVSRIGRAGGPSTCLNVRTCQPPADTDPRHYDSYTYVNTTGAPQCVSVSIDETGCGNAGVFSAAYLGSFDPSNLCTNWLADPGVGVGPHYTYSFTAPPGATIIITVNENETNVGCTSYTLSINNCAVVAGGTPTPGGATATTVAGTPTPTATVNCPVQPNWTPGPTLTPERAYFQGAVASDSKFYVTGGQDINAIPLNGVSRFNPATNAWEAVPALPVAVGQAATGSNGAQVFVAGGFTTANAITSTLQIYDLAANSWSFGASLPAAVEAAAGTVLNGKFYVIGGDDFSVAVRTTYIYDIATNTWTTGALVPDTNGRTNTNATAVNGKVYVFGGAYINGTTTVPIDTLLAYDPAANTYTNLGSANTASLGNYAGVSPYGPGKLLITDGGDGGFNGTTGTHIYDIGAASWTVGPAMTVPRLAHAQGTLPDGRVIVASGLTTSSATTPSVELLGPQIPCVTPSPVAASPTVAAPTVTPVSATNTPGAGGSPTATATVCTITFTDVDQNNPFYTFIRCLACRNIVSGYSDGTFRWGNDVTRGQLSKIIANSAGLTQPIPTTQQTFEDVPNTNAFWYFIEQLSAVGAISGYTRGGVGEPCNPPGNRPYFRWGANATRGQITKIDAIAANINDPVPTTQQTFQDVTNANPFWLFIEQLAGRNIISGYTCGGAGEPCVPPGNKPYFRWGANATRGQMSKIAAETFFPNCQTPAQR